MQFDTIPQKIQNRCTLHPCEDEKYSGFHFAALTDFCKIIRASLLLGRIYKLIIADDSGGCFTVSTIFNPKLYCNIA